MNYTGKIKTTGSQTWGNIITKTVKKVINGENKYYTIAYEIRSHQISLPFEDSVEVREALRYGKTIARDILEHEMHELIERYIDITIKDMEINYLYTNNWHVLTRSDGSVYRDINGNIILVKYYRVTPTAEFLGKYHTTDELEKMEKEKN